MKQHIVPQRQLPRTFERLRKGKNEHGLGMITPNAPLLRIRETMKEITGAPGTTVKVYFFSGHIRGRSKSLLRPAARGRQACRELVRGLMLTQGVPVCLPCQRSQK